MGKWKSPGGYGQGEARPEAEKETGERLAQPG